jgi:uncharacterized surface protein with fasciclin (FAS1) repeats
MQNQTRRHMLFAGAGFAMLAAPAVLRAQTTAVQGVRTLADVLAGDSRFTSLLDLVSRGGLVEDFRQGSQITLFAPTNEAFAGAPANLMAGLLGRAGTQGESADRQKIGVLVKAHMVLGAFPSSALTNNLRMRTVGGTDLMAQTDRMPIRIVNPAPAATLGSPSVAGRNENTNTSEVVQADIRASNGIIHAVSAIIWP